LAPGDADMTNDATPLSRSDQFRRSFAAGSAIFNEGDPGNCAYIIERGTVEISTLRGGQKIRLAARGPGEIFGEMAIIDSKPRSASALAESDCELLVISREQLINHVDQAKPIMHMLVTVILERFRDTLMQMRHAEAGLPENEPSISLAHFIDREASLRRHVEAIEQIKLEQRLLEALEKGQFELHYQPLIDLSAGEISGFEALVRWRHPDRGLIAPADFIAVAEDSGLIVEIGRWVFGEACRALAALRRARPEPEGRRYFMTVNVSGRQLQDARFLEAVQQVVSENGIDPEDLTLEVTESMLMQDPDRAARTLDAAAESGFVIALDDFGTGYSSLSYLHRFPIDTLKVDRSFVAALEDEGQSGAIVRSIVQLARGLSMRVVGEGIETDEQARLMRALGCDCGQGYFYAPPADLDTVAALLRDWPGTHR
jgi:EAL domain-containing protein (putative c-di-GMP-specific phosphodiesterase class I)